MERLTEKRDGQNTISLRQDGKLKWALCSAGMGDAPAQFLYGAHADKLAEYEDLEEQGKLLKLPCAVGDMTYNVNKSFGWIVDAVVKRIEIDTDGFWVITSAGIHSFDGFGKTVFLTREEAEAALNATLTEEN